MVILTDNPIKEVWNQLLFIANKENCKHLLDGSVASKRPATIMDQNLCELKSSQISFCIKQAYEFFLSIDRISIITSPLPLYYCMLNLAKALILANNPAKVLQELNYHGLYSRPIYQTLKTIKEASPPVMEQQFAVINEGIFNELVHLLHDFKFSPEKSFFYFHDLFYVIPEIKILFERYYGKKSRTYKILRRCPNLDQNYWFSTEEKDMDDLKERFPRLEREFDIAVSGFNHPIFNTHTSGISCAIKNPGDFPTSFNLYEGYPVGKHITGHIEYWEGETTQKEYCFNLLIIDFVTCFILSECSRYNPVLWQIVGSGETGLAPLLDSYVDSVKRRFPNEVLNNIYNEKMIFKTSDAVGDIIGF